MPTVSREEPFHVAAAEPAGTIEFDTSAVTFGGFTWAVPALVLTVPGLFLILAVGAQAMIGLIWLPVARRSLAGDRRRGQRPARG